MQKYTMHSIAIATIVLPPLPLAPKYFAHGDLSQISKYDSIITSAKGLPSQMKKGLELIIDLIRKG